MRPGVLLASFLALTGLVGCPSRLALEPRREECPGGVCAIPKPPPAPPVAMRTFRVAVIAEDIPVDIWRMDPIGMTHMLITPMGKIPYKVRLDPILDDRDWCRMVAVHEFGHVIGLGHYGMDAGWMGPAAGPDTPPPPGPSPAELLDAQRTSRGVLVVLSLDASLTPLMREAVGWAAGAWNKALEREVFTVK